MGGAEILPFESQGLLYDIAGSPTDPLFVLHHIMLDCVLQEWIKLHPDTVYPVSPLIRDGHRIDDYLRTFFPLVTNEEVFTNPEEFGVYCTLPNIGLTEPIGKWGEVAIVLIETITACFLFCIAPSPLEAIFSFFITGNIVEVCVETKSAALMKLVLRDVNNNRYVTSSKQLT